MRRTTRLTHVLLALLSLLLMACSASTMKVEKATTKFDDNLFPQYQNIKILSKEEVFALSPDLEQKLNQSEIQALSNHARAKYFLELLYSRDISTFTYNANGTTIATRTWEEKSGNCISLTILAYSVGRALKLPIVMQDVDVPVQFDRRGNVEFLNTHVNAMIRSKDFWFDTDSTQRGFLIIDFEPQTIVLKPGKPLDEQEVLSRFYNNLGAEYLAIGQRIHAYAYLRAALQSDPNNSLALSNLAQIYLQEGAPHFAENSLKQALHINPDDAVVMRSLQALLRQQNRHQEAQTLEPAIRASDEKNPHYLIGLGLHAMSQQRYHEAIDKLERAAQMTNGFAELHQALAEAYNKTGEVEKAKLEIRKLVSLMATHPKAKAIRSKFAQM